MNFYISLNIKSSEELKLFQSFNDSLPDEFVITGKTSKEFCNPANQNEKIIILGDLVTDDKNLSYETLKNAADKLRVHHYGGFFYLIYLETTSKKIKIFSSFLNILPIYYFTNNEKLVVSSSLKLLKKLLRKNLNINRKYLCEKILFNYSLFEQTIFQEIKLLPTNTYLIIDQVVSLKSFLQIQDLFSDEYTKGQKILDHLSDLFIASSKKYLPEEEFALSFTGGFDGRTLLAVSKYYKKNFFTYSFGSKTSKDLIIPMHQSKLLGIKFIPIYLNDEYINNFSYSAGKQMIELSDGQSSFGRAHYCYAADRLKDHVNKVITGNFGSELFRAMHNPGVMISQSLISFFKSKFIEEWIKQLKSTTVWKLLQRNGLHGEISSIADSLAKFKKYNTFENPNKTFYVFVLNEVFRKYFGAEIYMQRNFLNNRTPFLDFEFIQALFKTYYCGLQSDFFTHNPIKRFKGQLLYAHIIKKAFPDLLKLKTIKNYKPKDLLTVSGKLVLLKNKLLQIGENRSSEVDPYAVQKAFIRNEIAWTSQNNKSNYLDIKYIVELYRSNKLNLDLTITMLSLENYLSSIVEANHE